MRAAGLEPGRGGRSRRQRLRQGRAAAVADGIRGGSPEADFDLARGKRGVSGYVHLAHHSEKLEKF